MVVAFKPDRSDAQLRAFFDAINDGEIGDFFSFRGLGAGFRGNFDLGKAIVLIDGLQGVDVGCDHDLAVCAVAIQIIGGVNGEQLFQRCGIEVTVAGHRDSGDAAALAQRDIEEDGDLDGTGLLQPVLGLGVKVALALKEIAEAAIALVEQILVDAAFLEDGNNALDFFRIEVGPFHLHFYHWPLIGGEVEVDSLRFGVKLLRLELDLSLQPLHVLIDLENAGQRAIGCFAVYMLTQCEMRARTKGSYGHTGIARDRDCADARLRTADHMKGNID